MKIGAEAGQQKVRAWGPGLEGGVVGKSADFVVEAVGDNVGTLGKLELTEYRQMFCTCFCFTRVVSLRFLCGRSISGQDRM